MFVGYMPMALIGERFRLDMAFAGVTIFLVLAVPLGIVWSPLRLPFEEGLRKRSA